MREIRYTTRFKRDYKHEKSGRHSKIIDAALINVVNLLAADIPLPPLTLIIRFLVNGVIIATAMSSPISS